uniref:TRIO and F-actin binding protein n=1 Tax=Pelodiscus sinensis TaxID=13735 RepID=K7G0J9_PELSI
MKEISPWKAEPSPVSQSPGGGWAKHQVESSYFSPERRKSDSSWVSSPSRGSRSTLPTHSDLVRTGGHLTSSVSSLDSGLHRHRSGDGEGRHGLVRQEYTMLADLPKPKRISHREAFEQERSSSRTRSPGRAEVERIFGYERRKTETLEAFQALEEGLVERLDGKTPLLAKERRLGRRQSSPTLYRELHPMSAGKHTSERQSREEKPHPVSSRRYTESDQKSWSKSLGPMGPTKQPERDWRSQAETLRSRSPTRQPEGDWRSQAETQGPRSPTGKPERGWKSREETLCPRSQTQRSEDNWRTQEESLCHMNPVQQLERDWRSQGECLYSVSSRHQPETTSKSPVSPSQWKLCAIPCNASCWPVPSSWRHTPTSPQCQLLRKPRPLSERELVGPFSETEASWPLRTLDLEGCPPLVQAGEPQKEDTRESWYTSSLCSSSRQGSSGAHFGMKFKKKKKGKGRKKVSVRLGAEPGWRSGDPWLNLPDPARFGLEWSGTQEFPSPAQPHVTGLAVHCPPPPLFPPPPPELCHCNLGCNPRAQPWEMKQPDLLNFKKGWMSILDELGEWKKHWFVLTDSSLRYYRDSNAEEADDLDGEIDLRSCTDVTEYAVQRNYGFQIHTKDSTFTLSAMTSGIRRNWIEALRKNVRPATAPDVTKLSDCNKENSFRSCVSQKGSLRSEEQWPGLGSEVISKGGNRKADGPRHVFDYVELSPLNQGSPQRTRGSLKGISDRATKQEDLERDQALRFEERRKWFEAPDPGVLQGDSPAGALSWKACEQEPLGPALSEDQRSRLNEEIEKKWLELERLPLKESKRIPLMTLLNQSKGGHGDTREALEKEVQSLREQLESWRARSESLHDTGKSSGDVPLPQGFISQEACERSLAEMESLHQKVMSELQRHHQWELERLRQEKERLLAEEAAATAAAIEALKKVHKEELNKEVGRTRHVQLGGSGSEALRRQHHRSDVDSLKRELQVLSEQYSQKCLEIGDLTQKADEREQMLQRCQQEGKELLQQNQELQKCLSEEIQRLRTFIASQGTGDGALHNNERSSCELEVLLR